MKKPSVLIVDDHEGFRDSLVDSPILKSKYRPIGAAEGEAAIRIIQENPKIACVLLDYDLKGKKKENIRSGLEIMEELKEIAPHVPIFMMSGITDQRGSVAIESISQNAICFLDKPFSVKDFVQKLDEVVGDSNIDKQRDKSVCKKLTEFGFIAESHTMIRTCETAIDAAENDLPVLITGETGVGKTLLARAIHKIGKGEKAPFVEVGCGNFSSDSNTFHSQLFGHVRGAFTGASANKKGLIEAAQGGTLLLDDVTAMPLDMQKALLQAIELKKFRKFGAETVMLDFDSRIIATTNRAIEEAVASGEFREDLKYRLYGELIAIPPLRDRVSDIERITLNHLKNSPGLKVREIEKEALALLGRQPWLGNVRQLLNVLARAAAHEKNDKITIRTVQKELGKEYGFLPETANVIADYELDGDLETTLNNIREKFIRRALEKHEGSLSAASKELGFKNHQGLKYWIEKLEIEL